MDERRILTVSELNNAIRSLLEGRFPFLSVAGEISNLHRAASGHVYFTLKDSSAQIRAVLFKMQQRYLARPAKDGDHVICRGRISVYEPRGEYQLVVDTMEHQGAGALQQAFEQLKRRLAAEGLFDEHRKRPLPRFPDHIVVVTSPRGAAVHDFIRIATRRWPLLRLSIVPVSVQGDRAAGEMIRALNEINTHLAGDLIVLCRGGGSIEDLWCLTMNTWPAPFAPQTSRWLVPWAMKSISPSPILPPISAPPLPALRPSSAPRTV
jgi:exodeoxyribonuclease VII large subunit